MILIADSGSTKTQLTAIDPADGTAKLLTPTRGINPMIMTTEQIAEVLRADLTPLTATDNISAIHWYGAGCAGPHCLTMANLLREATGCPDITVDSDMLCAARAMCGTGRGIVGILGTGSNSCLYDGERITHNVSPLGYILGDEGSGAVLGRMLIGDILKRQLPADLCDEFAATYNLSQAQIIASVYRSESPNRFLASFAPFLSSHIGRPEVERLVTAAFNSFVTRNLLSYEGCRELPVHFIGSIAYHFRPQLIRACEKSGLRVGLIEQSPAERIARYHIHTQQNG